MTINGAKRRLTGWTAVLWVVAVCGATLAGPAGCEDEEAAKKTKDQLTKLAKERDDFLHERDKARDDLRVSTARLARQSADDLAKVQAQCDEYARVLDRIREELVKSRAQGGTASSSNRLYLASDVAELVRELKDLRLRYESLQDKSKALDGLDARISELTRENERLRQLLPAGSGPGVQTQPDLLHVVPGG